MGVTRAESYFVFNSGDVQYGIEGDRRSKILRTYVRSTYSYHLNEILATIVNEYTDWERPVQHPINIRYGEREKNQSQLENNFDFLFLFYHAEMRRWRHSVMHRLWPLQRSLLIYILPIIGTHFFMCLIIKQNSEIIPR